MVRGVVAGQLNKQIAADLGVSEITVKVRRGNAMRKLQLRSVADVVRLWDRLQVLQTDAGSTGGRDQLGRAQRMAVVITR